MARRTPIAELVRVQRRRRSSNVDRLADQAGARIRRDLEEPEVGLRRDRPAQPDLLHAGRRRPPDQAPAHPPVHHRGRRAARAADRQRLPRRRRQHPPDPPLRRARRRPGPPRPRWRATRSSTSASPSAGASPASMASASRRWSSCPGSVRTGRPRRDGGDPRSVFNPGGLCSPDEGASFWRRLPGEETPRSARLGVSGDRRTPTNSREQAHGRNTDQTGSLEPAQSLMIFSLPSPRSIRGSISQHERGPRVASTTATTDLDSVRIPPTG